MTTATTRITKLEKTIRARAREAFEQQVAADFDPAIARSGGNDAAIKLLFDARANVIRSGKAIAENQALEQFLAERAPEVLTPAPISLDALRNPIQIRIGANGERLPDTATDYVAVLLPQFDLLYSVETQVADNWKAAVALGPKFVLFDDQGEWQVWDDIEAQLIIDRSRTDPAVIETMAAHTPTDHIYWTRRPLASSPADLAVYVNLHSGNVSWYYQSSRGRVRFCRRVRASQF